MQSISLQRPAGAARKATMAVRFCRVEIPRPRRHTSARDDLPASVPLCIVDVIEINPPEGIKPAHWRLLTSHEVDTFAKARWIAGFYRQRWLIEELFRTLKTRGSDIERVSVAEGPFEKLAVAAIIAAVTVLQLGRARDGNTNRPAAMSSNPTNRKSSRQSARRVRAMQHG